MNDHSSQVSTKKLVESIVSSGEPSTAADSAAIFKEIAPLFISLSAERYTIAQKIDNDGLLEKQLWPFYDNSSSFEFTFTIILIISDRCKTGVVISPFDALTKAFLQDQTSSESRCEAFFRNVANIALDDSLKLHPYLLDAYIYFLICCFRNLEDAIVKKNMLRYLSLPIWESLSESRLSSELQKNPQLAKFWKSYLAKMKASEKGAGESAPTEGETSAATSSKKQKKSTSTSKPIESISEDSVKDSNHESTFKTMRRDAKWMPTLLEHFLTTLQSVNNSDDNLATQYALRYIERFLEFLIDLLSQVPTRKFLRTLLDDMHFLFLCKHYLSELDHKSPLLDKLVSSLEAFLFFEIDDQSGKALTAKEVLEEANERHSLLQQVAFAEFPGALQDLTYSSLGELAKRETLVKHFDQLDDAQLRDLASKMHVLSEKNKRTPALQQREAVCELLCERLVVRPRQLKELNRLPLYPTEELLWDSNQLPRSEGFSGNEVQKQILIIFKQKKIKIMNEYCNL